MASIDHSYNPNDAAIALLNLHPNPTPNPRKRKRTKSPPSRRTPSPTPSQDAGIIRCICSIDEDDGFTIACDGCNVWQHGACFGIQEGKDPPVWHCEECKPRPVDRVVAHELQLRRRAEREREARKEAAAALQLGETTRRRRMSSAAVDRARKPPTSKPPKNGTARSTSGLTDGEEDAAREEDARPWTTEYVPITTNIASEEMRARMQVYAHDYASVTTEPHQRPLLPRSSTFDPLRTTPDLTPAQTTVKALPHETNNFAAPPTYALHASNPIPSSSLISHYVCNVTPSSEYLANPTNQYVHLGLPKPHVRLLPPPLDVALDARTAGNEARFARNGCHPNAVIRPVLCKGEAGESLMFGVFAIRDLKAKEEVVLGWEWDDGHIVHHLPAIIEADTNVPNRHYLQEQMANMLHTLSSTFTTCACGAKAKDCAVAQMARFVEDPRPSSSMDPHPHRRYLPLSQSSPSQPLPDLGPLVGSKRGFRTREVGEGGMRGVELVRALSTPSAIMPLSTEEEFRVSRVQINGRPHPRSHLVPKHGSHSPSPAPLSSDDETGAPSKRKSATSQPGGAPKRPRVQTSDALVRPNGKGVDRSDMATGTDKPVTEDLMPPRTRKKWAIPKSALSPATPSGSLGPSVEQPRRASDSDLMPPPRFPASRPDPMAISSITIDMDRRPSSSPSSSSTTLPGPSSPSTLVQPLYSSQAPLAPKTALLTPADASNYHLPSPSLNPPSVVPDRPPDRPEPPPPPPPPQLPTPPPLPIITRSSPDPITDNANDTPSLHTNPPIQPPPAPSSPSTPSIPSIPPVVVSPSPKASSPQRLPTPGPQDAVPTPASEPAALVPPPVVAPEPATPATPSGLAVRKIDFRVWKQRRKQAEADAEASTSPKAPQLGLGLSTSATSPSTSGQELPFSANPATPQEGHGAEIGLGLRVDAEPPRESSRGQSLPPPPPPSEREPQTRQAKQEDIEMVLADRPSPSEHPQSDWPPATDDAIPPRSPSVPRVTVDAPPPPSISSPSATSLPPTTLLPALSVGSSTPMSPSPGFASPATDVEEHAKEPKKLSFAEFLAKRKSEEVKHSEVSARPPSPFRKDISPVPNSTESGSGYAHPHMNGASDGDVHHFSPASPPRPSSPAGFKSLDGRGSREPPRKTSFPPPNEFSRRTPPRTNHIHRSRDPSPYRNGPTHEDGEIIANISDSPTHSHPERFQKCTPPSAPTQPRMFGSPSQHSTPGPNLHHRPRNHLPPFRGHHTGPYSTPNSSPRPPSGPRALRAQPYGPPRGPSADRERERQPDRGWGSRGRGRWGS